MSKSTIQDTISSNGVNILFANLNMRFFMFTDFERRSGKDRHPDIDGVIKLKDENENYLELYLHYQTKSHLKISNLKKYKIEKKDVKFLTKTNVPTLFFIVDVNKRKSYWYFLDESINSSKGITIDVSKNEIAFDDSQKINLKWRKIAKSDSYSEIESSLVSISKKFNLNIKACLGILYLFGAIQKQEFTKIVSALISVKEYESRTIIEHLKKANIISSTVNYYLLENQKLGIESLFLLLDSELLDFKNLDKLNFDNKKIVFERLSKIDLPIVRKYFNRLIKEFISHLPKFKNNDDIFANLELLEKYIYKVPNQAIRILKIIINSKKPLEVTVENIKGWGEMEGKSHKDLLEKSIELLERLRYIKQKEVFALLMKLARLSNDDVMEKAIKALEKQSEYNLSVLQEIGYQSQIILLEEIKKFGDRKLLTNFEAIGAILKQLIKPSFEGSGMTDYKTFTIRRGGLTVGKNIINIRKQAIDILRKLFLLSKTVSQKKKVLEILMEATQTPYDNYTKELESLILSNTNRIIKFYNEIIEGIDYELIKQIENQCIWFKKRYAGRLRGIKKLENFIYSNGEYDIFKVFVGHDYYLSKSVGWKKAEKNRMQKIKKLAGGVSDDNFAEWEKRILHIIDGYKKEEDYSRYRYFNIFLEEIGESNPSVAEKLIKNNEVKLGDSLVSLLVGIWNSGEKEIAIRFINNFLKDNERLSMCAVVFLRIREIDTKLLKLIFQKAKKAKDINALNNIIRSIVGNYPDDNRHIKLFIETIKELTKLKSCWWVNNVWYQEDSIIENLAEDNFDIILNSLLLVPSIDYHSEAILEIIGKKYPLKVVDFFAKRVLIQSKKSKKERYDAIPYEFHKLGEVLNINKKIIIPHIFEWFKNRNWLINWEAGHFLEKVYSLNDLDKELTKLINSNNKKNIEVVMSIFSTYQGKLSLDDKVVRVMIRKYSKYHNSIMSNMSMPKGIVSGEYGLVDSLQSKKRELQKWKKDIRKYMQNFVKKYEKYLKAQIDYEKKRSDEELELRKYEYN